MAVMHMHRINNQPVITPSRLYRPLLFQIVLQQVQGATDVRREFVRLFSALPEKMVHPVKAYLAFLRHARSFFVIPAKAGIQLTLQFYIPGIIIEP